MARKIKKYNPGFLTDQELVDCFCVRTGEFALLVEALRESTGNSNPHAIVIGPRGSGKTTLLLRVAAEARRDPALPSGLVPGNLSRRELRNFQLRRILAAVLVQSLAAGSPRERRARPESHLRGTPRHPG